MSTYKYACIENNQRGGKNTPRLLLFSARAGDIDAWAAIERHTSDSKKGPQRLKKPAKVAEVKRFFSEDPRNTIPTALLVSLQVPTSCVTSNAKAASEVVTLEIGVVEGRVKPGMIIDGQHRLLGALAYDPDLMLNVVAMLNPSDEETAFQFLVVNNKASRVSSNHLRALALEYKEEELKKRLQNVRMSLSHHLDFVGLVDTESSSPFNGIIDWPNNVSEQDETKRGFVAPNAIESSVAYIKQKRITELEDDSILLGFFLTIWTQIKKAWPSHFNSQTHLLEKVPIICLTQFLTDNLAFEYDKDELDVTDFDEVAKCVDQVISMIPAKFWSSRWIAKSLDTAVGRTLFLESLRQIRRNMNAERAWYEDVAMIDSQSDLL